jgi:hypothetical protein
MFGLGVCLKWQTACLASTRPRVQTPVWRERGGGYFYSQFGGFITWTVDSFAFGLVAKQNITVESMW